jgi:hypothetical protein
VVANCADKQSAVMVMRSDTSIDGTAIATKDVASADVCSRMCIDDTVHSALLDHPQHFIGVCGLHTDRQIVQDILRLRSPNGQGDAGHAVLSTDLCD